MKSVEWILQYQGEMYLLPESLGEKWKGEFILNGKLCANIRRSGRFSENSVSYFLCSSGLSFPRQNLATIKAKSIFTISALPSCLQEYYILVAPSQAWTQSSFCDSLFSAYKLPSRVDGATCILILSKSSLTPSWILPLNMLLQNLALQFCWCWLWHLSEL